jgi:hypothetical protein
MTTRKTPAPKAKQTPASKAKPSPSNKPAPAPKAPPVPPTKAKPSSSNKSSTADKKSALTTTKGSTSSHLSKLSGSQLAHAVLNHHRWKGTDGDDARKDILQYQERGVRRIVLRGLLAIMDGGWDVHVSVIRAGHHVDGLHNPRGIAVDLNNYGPGGAYSHLPGTSSTNPTRFVHWLRENRAALGHLRIGGGAEVAKWGTDFADSDTHIHLDWKHG